MQLAKERFSGLDFKIEFLPFEFDPPGRYPSDACFYYTCLSGLCSSGLLELPLYGLFDHLSGWY